MLPTGSEVVFFRVLLLHSKLLSSSEDQTAGSICGLGVVNYEQTGCFAHKRPRPLTFSKGKGDIKKELFDHQGGRKLSYIQAVLPLTSAFLPLGTSSNRNVPVEERPNQVRHKEQKLRFHKSKKKTERQKTLAKKNNFEQESFVT